MKLRVEEATVKADIGRNIARIGPQIMKEIGIGEGGPLLLIGKKNTCTKVLPADKKDIGLKIIRIDGFIRKNCEVSLQDEIDVEKAEVSMADRITLAPVDIKISVDADFIRFVKDRVVGRYVIKGDIVTVTMLNHTVPFHVVETVPEYIVELSALTKMNVLSYPIGYYSRDCAFQKYVTPDNIRCGLIINEVKSKFDPKNYEECIIEICPIYQTWKLLNNKKENE